MCGRFAIDGKANEFIEELVEAYGMEVLGHVGDFLPRYNIKPTEQVPVILHSAKVGADVLTTARWSYVPPYAKAFTDAQGPTFNARAESAMTSERSGRASMWRDPLTKGRRCLIPASGYYEWTGPKNARTPHWLYLADEVLMFAGLYGWWADKSKAEDDPERWVLTTAILTMPTVPELAEIHDRNPIALPESMWWDWISPEVQGDQALVDAAVAASRPVMSGLLAHVVAPLRGDGPELTRALDASR